MSFLKRLALIRQINNGRDAEHIGQHPEGHTFIQEAHGRCCVISEPTLVQALLEHQDVHAYNHLSDFLADVEPEAIHHLQHFLEQSPEFLEGHRQRERLKETKRILRDFETACRRVQPEELRSAIEQVCNEGAPLTTSRLSKAALSSFLTQALTHHRDGSTTKPFHPGLIATQGGFFSAAPRVRRLQEMNQSIGNQWEPTPQPEQDDEQYLLELLRIMGSIPMHVAITGSLNALQQLQIGSETNDTVPATFLTKDCFKRVVPTRYVTRRVAHTMTVEGITFEKGDGLILFLADATQTKECPLKMLRVLPFGAGRHFCPGKSIAQIIHNTCLQAIVKSRALQNASPSECKQDSLNAFVDFTG